MWHDREIIPVDLADAPLMGAWVAGRRVLARVVATGAHLAPVHRGRSQLVSPAVHSPREGICLRQLPIALAEDEMIGPGDAGNVALAPHALFVFWK